MPELGTEVRVGSPVSSQTLASPPSAQIILILGAPQLVWRLKVAAASSVQHWAAVCPSPVPRNTLHFL